jgi:hypothetical protein
VLDVNITVKVDQLLETSTALIANAQYQKKYIRDISMLALNITG